MSGWPPMPAGVSKMLSYRSRLRRDSGENTGPAPYEVPLLESPTVENESYSLFDTPLDLSQVDYIKYGDAIISANDQ